MKFPASSAEGSIDGQLAETEAERIVKIGASNALAGNRAGASPSVYTFWRGRVAFYGILKGLGVGSGDGVIVPGFTCSTVPAAVQMAGAEPLYADIDPETFNLSLASCRGVLESSTGPRARAVLLQYTYGVPANVQPISVWAREQGLEVIEDCAHALGSRYRNGDGAWRPVGSAGVAAFFSSHWNKPVSTGVGGWAMTRDAALQQSLRRFHDRQCLPPSWWEVVALAGQVAVREIIYYFPGAFWMARDAYRWMSERGWVVGSSSPEELRGGRAPDYSKQMSAFQEWLLHKRLGDLALQAHRRQLAAIYTEELRAAGFEPLRVPEDADPVLLCYPVRVRNKARTVAEARRRRLELGDWYRQPVDSPDGVSPEHYGYRAGMCPQGERAAREVVTLPMHRGVTAPVAHRLGAFLRDVRNREA